MNKKRRSLLPAMALVLLLVLQSSINTISAQGPGGPQRPSLPHIPIKGDTTHTLSRHFTQSSAAKNFCE